jgi:hypothetical protein
VGCYETNTR